ncbi:glycosyltransferase 61 family protein [Brytella acorum]|nr:glycosyltransferase 61 family protein [Brytella acorum]MDF3625755.1 glycosyltransferase 61 family protein [Brytella acorum]
MASGSFSVLVDTDAQSLSLWRRKCLDGNIQRLEQSSAESIRTLAHQVRVGLQESDLPSEVLFRTLIEALPAASEAGAAHAVARLAYVISRKPGSYWQGLFPYFRASHRSARTYFNASFSFEDEIVPTLPARIRQCRPDRESYGLAEVEQIGLFNKNRKFLYRSYNKAEAQNYLGEYFGRDVLDLFNAIHIPQGESDFFLLASLLREGGVSADVCSVAKASISPLLAAVEGVGVVERDSHIEKNFFCAPAGSPLIRAYFEKVLAYLVHCAEASIAPSYEQLTSRDAFQSFLFDSFCEGLDFVSSEKLTLIDGSTYDAFVQAGVEEENLCHVDDGASFPRTSLLGRASPGFVDVSWKADRVVSSLPGHYFAPSDHVRLIGHNAVPHLIRQAHDPVAIPKLNIFQTYDLGLSGHGCIWKDGRFLRLEAYLSFVAESETHHGHWRTPASADAVRIVEEPSIVAFGAGFGCYGHYLVDDVPRLALARHLLGEEAYQSRRVIVPQSTPDWAIGVLKALAGVREEALLFFDHTREFLQVRDAIVPSFAHRDYRFHSFVRDYYGSLAKNAATPFRRICLSRRAWEPHKVNQRVFEEQEKFEGMAVERGFELVAPETLPIEDQIRLLAETRCQIGEHGSAQHASIYNRFGMTVGTINPLTEIQTNLGRLYGDTNVITFADGQRGDDKGNTFFSLSDAKLEQFFATVEAEDRARSSRYRSMASL